MTDNPFLIQTERNLVAQVKYRGADSLHAKNAAIEYCHAVGLDPYTRYPTGKSVELSIKDSSAEISYEEEWQHVIRAVLSA